MKWRDPLILVFLIVILWQVLYALIGDVALRSPATTAHNLGTLLSDPRFLPHINETSIAFHIRMGFEIEPGDVIVDGISAHSNYDGRGESRVLFVKHI